jgi:SRSO17 transposase
MTEQQIVELGPALASYLHRFERYFLRRETIGHFRDFCRGLLSDVPRKSVEPIALAAGVTVRTMQVFLTQGAWDHLGHRDELQRDLVDALTELPADGLGTIGLLDETSSVKKGEETPGVQRQHCGAVGKVENCIVTVHLGVARGRFKTLIDADLFLPKSWDADRKRCRKAGIPDDLGYRPKWEIGFDQLLRAHSNGLRFDWLTFDEDYGKVPRFLALLDFAGQHYVGEVPVIFSCRVGRAARARRADWMLKSAAACRQKWRRFRLRRETEAVQIWEAKIMPIRLSRSSPRAHQLIVARNLVTHEVKYFVTNAPRRVGLERLLRVAFSRWKIEHCFRVIKSEVGLTHFEGRKYTGLMRHMISCLTVLAFVALHTERLRGEKSTGDDGASLSGAERPLLGLAGPPTPHEQAPAHGGGHQLPPSPQRSGTPLQTTSSTNDPE